MTGDRAGDATEHVVLGMCTDDDPEHVHEIADEHDQSDLVHDGKCPDCSGLVDLGECQKCGKWVHEHYVLQPPSDGSQGRACPECTVGIDRILVCTYRQTWIVWPCQHEMSPARIFSRP